MIELLFFSDREVKSRLFARVDASQAPLLVTALRQEKQDRPPAEREPFASLEKRFGARLEQILVVDEGKPEGMWRDPLGDLAERFFPTDASAAHIAARSYLLLAGGRVHRVVKKQSAKEDAAALFDAISRWLPKVRSSRSPKPPVDQDPDATDPRGVPLAVASVPSTEAAWKVLGLAPGVSRDEARKAYHARLAQYHPDKVAHLAAEFQELAERRTREILEAWQTLQALWQKAK